MGPELPVKLERVSKGDEREQDLVWLEESGVCHICKQSGEETRSKRKEKLVVKTLEEDLGNLGLVIILITGLVLMDISKQFPVSW